MFSSFVHSLSDCDPPTDSKLDPAVKKGLMGKEKMGAIASLACNGNLSEGKRSFRRNLGRGVLQKFTQPTEKRPQEFLNLLRECDEFFQSPAVLVLVIACIFQLTNIMLMMTNYVNSPHKFTLFVFVSMAVMQT